MLIQVLAGLETNLVLSFWMLVEFSAGSERPSWLFDNFNKIPLGF